MKRLLLATLILGGACSLAACSNVAVNDYANNSPKLVPQKFYNGQLSAHGVVKNRSGKVIRYFNATIKAYWVNDVGTLEEKFLFDDGEVQYRTWTLTPDKNNASKFSGTANDVIGAGRGIFSGNAMNVNYVLAVKYNDSTLNVRVDDWMWLVDEKTIINESTLTKFGFRVGSVQLVISRDD